MRYDDVEDTLDRNQAIETAQLAIDWAQRLIDGGPTVDADGS